MEVGFETGGGSMRVAVDTVEGALGDGFEFLGIGYASHVIFSCTAG